MTQTHQQSYLHVVAGLIRRDDEILLVEQQWPNAPTTLWTLPGGRIEPGELLTEALNREVKEETGLDVIDPGQLLYTLHHDTPDSARQTFSFVFNVAQYRGEIAVNDPDNYVLGATFLPQAQAIAKLKNQRLWRAMREPVITYLQGQSAAGAAWVYRNDELVLGP